MWAVRGVGGGGRGICFACIVGIPSDFRRFSSEEVSDVTLNPPLSGLEP